MAPFFPVYIRRSDGKLQTSKGVSVKGPTEPNEPTPEQLSPKPNAQGISDFYRPCEPGHGKEIDWRRKLAGMLIRELGTPDLQDSNFILSAFPENYRLYEHVRTKTTDANGATKAAAVNERQDSYLYGHPQGRKKRYRSPADFFPHLLWLSTDEKGDPNNCSCRICSPEEIEVGEEEKAATIAKAKAQSKAALGQVKNAAADGDGQQAGRRVSQTQAPASSLPRLRSYEQKLDKQYNGFLYRPGEVVWFQRGQAWGLGVVVSRSMRSLSNSTKVAAYRYRVQPLSHQFGHVASTDCGQDQLRNWLAWSPPPCLNPKLHPSPQNGMKQYTYESVDWRAHVHDPSTSSTDAEVDSSILAAKMVETTYTLFELIESKTSTGAALQVSQKFYNGVYLGAEKIWLGDPLRLRAKDNTPCTDILVLRQILERQHPGDASRFPVLLTGDVYIPITVPSNTLATTSPLHPTNLFPTLPARVRADLTARNALAASSSNASVSSQTHTLKLTGQSVPHTFSSIKGRWYESSLFMPILNPVDYNTQKRTGELADCGLWMNGHGDCNKPLHGTPPYKSAEVRCKKREEAFGTAVPKNFQIITQERETPIPAPTAQPVQQASSQAPRPAPAAASQPVSTGRAVPGGTASQTAGHNAPARPPQNLAQAAQAASQLRFQQPLTPQSSQLHSINNQSRGQHYTQTLQQEQPNSAGQSSIIRTSTPSQYTIPQQNQQNSAGYRPQPQYHQSNVHVAVPVSASGQAFAPSEQQQQAQPSFDELMDFEGGT